MTLMLVLSFILALLAMISIFFLAYNIITYILQKRHIMKHHAYRVDPALFAIAEDTLKKAEEAHRLAEDQHIRVELLKMEVEVITRGEWKR